MVWELRDQLDDLRSHALVGNALEKAGLAVVDDDLLWLSKDLDMTQAHAGSQREQLLALMENETSLRIVYGSLRSSTIRRETKLQQLEEELQLLQKDASDTPSEIQKNNTRSEALIYTEGRVLEMETQVAQALAYEASLEHMWDRLLSMKQGNEDAVQALRFAAEEMDAQINKQLMKQKRTSHAAWQARNAASLNLQLFAAQAQARSKLKVKRRQMLEKATQEKLQKDMEQKVSWT